MKTIGGFLYDAVPEQRDFQMHSHTGYEIFCFLEGDAYFMVEATKYELVPGDIFLMRPGESHHIVFRSSTPYTRIVISFETLSPLAPETEKRLLLPFCDRALGQHNRYAFSDFSKTDLRLFLEKLANAKDEETRFCYLLPLLNELGAAYIRLQEAPRIEIRHELSSILDYINLHLAEPLTLDLLCKRFYISRTHINRQFKKITGATVWEYITVKRLFFARELLAKGIPPTEAYVQCGFGDYTTFFRAYKKHFHSSPKQIAAAVRSAD